jgi:2-methylisocitrate lyase-like PEP mutase family enzyme
MTNPTTLRELIDQPSLVVAPGVFDGLSAALVQAAGFDAAYMSGAAVSASAVGLPDIGLATMTEFAAQARVIRRQTALPLLADADTGFGDVTHVYRTVTEYVDAGVSGIQLEDQVFPKRCGHLDEKEIVSRSEFIDKVQAAVQAKGETDVLIVARTDARATYGLSEALSRAQAYADAGADMVFVEAPQTLDEIRAIPSELSVPVVFNIVPRGKTPEVSLDDLGAFGYRMVILPAICISTATTAMARALGQLRSGVISSDHQASPRELFDIVGLPFWDEFRSNFQGDNINA